MYPYSISLCEVEFFKLLSWTLFFSENYRDYIISGYSLYFLSFVTWYFSFFMSFFLNTALCVDLMIVLSNPFKPVENRTLTYLIVSTVLALAIIVLNFIIVKDQYALTMGYVLTFIPVMTFCLAAVVSSIYAFCKLRSPGISS